MMRESFKQIGVSHWLKVGALSFWLFPAIAVGADYILAKKAVRDGDSKRAFKEWRLSAQEGYPEAQNALANLHFYGIGTHQDYREALKWYEKVSRQGDPEALKNMGHIYANGLGGVRKNLRKAFSLYLKAANLGNFGGQYFVGHFYARGLGVEKDNVQALMWFDLVVSKSRVSFNEFQSAGADALFYVHRLKSKMTPDEILLAQELFREWKPSEE